MKKRKKNNRLSFLTAIVCLLLFAGVLFLGMKNYEPEKSENPVQGVNSESSLKGYLGKGYAYAGSQEDASTGEESSFEEQAQILEDEPEEEPEKKKEEAQATVTPEPTSEPEASQTPEPDSQKEDTQKGDADPEDGSTGDVTLYTSFCAFPLMITSSTRNESVAVVMVSVIATSP